MCFIGIQELSISAQKRLIGDHHILQLDFSFENAYNSTVWRWRIGRSVFWI